MPRRMNHLLIFGSVAIVAWVIGTLLLISFWPHLVNNIYKKAVLSQGFGEGPIPINTLYTEPPGALCTAPRRAIRLGLPSDDDGRQPRHTPCGWLARLEQPTASPPRARLLPPLLQRAVHR